MSCVYHGRRLFAVSEMLFHFDRPLDSQVRFGVDDVFIYLFILLMLLMLTNSFKTISTLGIRMRTIMFV